jgi:hypothetical protein
VARGFDADGLAAAQAFATTASSIGSAVEAAIRSITAITQYGGAGLAEALQAFVADMQTVITTLAATSGALAATGEPAAQGFASTARQIKAAIEAGMAALVSPAAGAGGMASAMAAMVQAVNAAMAEIATAFAGLTSGAWGFGNSWVYNLINGIEAALPDLEAVLAYIRGLFPSSPAEHGPFKRLPDGAPVGARFAGDMAGGLWGGAGDVFGAMGALRDAFNGGAGLGMGGMQPAYAGAGAGGNTITVNINNPTVRDDRDIKRIADAVSEALAQRASTSSRLGQTW